MTTENAKNSNTMMSVKLSSEIIETQGKNDREYLTLRMKLLLDAMEKHPNLPVNDIVKLAGTTACGQGSCCCCGPCCNVPINDPMDIVINPVKEG